MVENWHFIRNVISVISLMPTGAYILFKVLFSLWFTFTLVGVFSALISIIKKVLVLR